MNGLIQKMAVHTATQNFDVSLALEFPKHLSNASRKHGILDNGKHTKGPVKTFTNRDYYVQYNKDVNNQDVKMYREKSVSFFFFV